MAKILFITENGKEILYADHSYTKDDEMAKVIEEQRIRILKENKKFRMIVDVTGSFTTPTFMKAAYRFGEDTKHLLIRGAILGINGAKKVLLRGYNLTQGSKALKPFETKEDAIKYVTKD